MMSMTACILFRDSVESLPACIDSVIDVADDVLVVVCGDLPDPEGLPASVRTCRLPWRGDEGALRAAAANHALGARVLFLDGRERLVLRGELAAPSLWRGGAGVLIEVVEADRAAPDVARVAAGEGCLTEPRLEARLLDRGVARTFHGVREPRPELAISRLPRVDACIVSTIAIRTAGQSDAETAAWIRATVAAPGDAHVLAAASRHLREQGHRDLSKNLAIRAFDSALDGQVDALHSATIAIALCELDAGDAHSAHAHVAAARGRLLSHPDLDLLQALAAIELNRPELRGPAMRALRQSLSRADERFVHRPLPGATGDAARLALATLLIASGEATSAGDVLDRLAPASTRSLPAVLLRAEQALLTHRPATALRILVDRLEHAGADGWILAADAAYRLDQRDDRNAFIDRAEAHLDRGLLAPHRTERLRAVRAAIAAEAVLPRLCGDVPLMPELDDPRALGENAASCGDLDRAHAMLIEALRREPTDVVAWNDLGVVLHQGGALDAAALALRVAVELAPEDADLRLQLAVVSWSGGHLADACEQARQALRREELVDARALLSTLDVEGARPPRVAIPADRADLAPVVRLAGGRPLIAEPDLVEALGGLWAWAAAAGPDVVLDETPDEALALLAPVVAPSVGFDALVRAIQGVRIGERSSGSRVRPVLSVVVPSRDRLASVVTLLDRLALQDLPPALMEVVVVDDGSALPIEREALGARPFAVRLVSQRPMGPASARNAGIEAARGRFVWMLDDDARPAPDAARLHLVGQLQAEDDVVLVGGMRLLERHRRTVWDHLLDTSALYRGRPDAPLGEALSWRSLSVCNTSAPRSLLLDVGGFDAVAFPEGSHEDAELGLRLDQRGVPLIHRPDIHAGQDRRIGVDAWLAQARANGRGQAALRVLHPERDDVLRLGDGAGPVEPVIDALRTVLEVRTPRMDQGLDALRRLAQSPIPADPTLARKQLLELRHLAEILGDHAHQQGLVDSRRRVSGPAVDPVLATTTVVLAHRSHDLGSDEVLAAIIEDVRRHSPGPVEVVVACMGPAPVATADVVVVPVPGNDVITAWNLGIARATGETIFLCDDAILFSPGWREALLAHVSAWPDVGVVSALGARVRSDLDGVAARFHRDRAGEHAWPVRVQLARTLIRRDVILHIGGLDATMGELAGHDLVLRARRAGFRVRLAGDVLMGAVDRQLSPTPDHVRAFRARHGIDPLERTTLQEAAELPFDGVRDRRELRPIDGPTVLLEPGGLPFRPIRPAEDDVAAVAK